VRYARFAIVLLVSVALAYFVWDKPIVRDPLLWVLMSYIVIGSVTGGVRRVVAELTGKNLGFPRSKLGHSWAAFTLWLLRKTLGVKPTTGAG
jgi:predicted neutral ceramidase superfamily lipid hydrolase